MERIFWELGVFILFSLFVRIIFYVTICSLAQLVEGKIEFCWTFFFFNKMSNACGAKAVVAQNEFATQAAFFTRESLETPACLQCL